MKKGSLVIKDIGYPGGVTFEERQDGKLLLFEEPKLRGKCSYIIGATIENRERSRSYSCAQVLKINPIKVTCKGEKAFPRFHLDQVAEWVGEIHPNDFSYELFKLGTFFKKAEMAVDSFSEGKIVIGYLKDGNPLKGIQGYANLYQEKDGDEYGVELTPEKETGLIYKLDEFIHKDKINLQSSVKEQLKTLTQVDRYPTRVITLGLTCILWRPIYIYIDEKEGRWPKPLPNAGVHWGKK